VDRALDEIPKIASLNVFEIQKEAILQTLLLQLSADDNAGG
jgi:hypothetical protein